jgi:type VI protein secretion system component Hcp
MGETVYLDLDGITGASKDHRHPKWTLADHAGIISGDPEYKVTGSNDFTTKAGPVEGFRFSITTPDNAPIQNAVPQLLSMYQSGQRLQKAIAESWWGSQMIYRLTMKDVFISSIWAKPFSCYLQFQSYEIKRGKT